VLTTIPPGYPGVSIELQPSVGQLNTFARQEDRRKQPDSE